MTPPPLDPVGLVRWVLDLRYFDPTEEGGPALEATFAPGDTASKLLVVTGDNASGKSFFRRLVGAACAEHTPKVEHIATSLEGRGHTRYNPGLAFVYGSEEWEATGSNSANVILGAIRTARGRETAHLVTWDEPELGLSEGAQVGAGQALADFGRTPGAKTQTAVIITHSRLLVRELADQAPHFLYFGRTEPYSLADWLQAPVQPRSLEDIKTASTARLRKIAKILKD